MIVAGTDQYLGNDEPGMVLQCRYREGGIYIWNDYLVDGKPVLSPIKIEALRLVSIGWFERAASD